MEGNPIDHTFVQMARIRGAELEEALPLALDWVLTNYPIGPLSAKQYVPIAKLY